MEGSPITFLLNGVDNLLRGPSLTCVAGLSGDLCRMVRRIVLLLTYRTCDSGLVGRSNPPD